MHDPSTFVKQFESVWTEPLAHLDTFLDFLAPQVRLTAPIVGTTVGRHAGYRAFRHTFQVLPDLRAQVRSWAARGDHLYIEMEFAATIGTRRVTWANVDRFLFEGGAAVERCAFFDPLPLLKEFLRSPAGWRQLWLLARGPRVAR